MKKIKVIERKLDNLSRCLARVASKRPEHKDVFLTDFDIQDIIALNLERAIQSCVDIAAIIGQRSSDQGFPSTMAGWFELMHRMDVIDLDTATALKSAVGFRNILVHDYTSVDWEIVWNILNNCLDGFKAFGQQVSTYCELST